MISEVLGVTSSKIWLSACIFFFFITGDQKCFYRIAVLKHLLNSGSVTHPCSMQECSQMIEVE